MVRTQKRPALSRAGRFVSGACRTLQ